MKKQRGWIANGWDYPTKFLPVAIFNWWALEAIGQKRKSSFADAAWATCWNKARESQAAYSALRANLRKVPEQYWREQSKSFDARLVEKIGWSQGFGQPRMKPCPLIGLLSEAAIAFTIIEQSDVDSPQFLFPELWSLTLVVGWLSVAEQRSTIRRGRSKNDRLHVTWYREQPAFGLIRFRIEATFIG